MGSAARSQKPAEPQAKSPERKARVERARAAGVAAIKKTERSSPPMAEIDGDVLEFIAAIDRFKLEHGRPFPNWSEILLIVRQLGYKRG
jgi:hypothetical protein